MDGLVWFAKRLQLERKSFAWVAKSALAALLIFLFVLASAVSANHALHKALHRGATAGNHLCLICALIKGHVGAAEAAPFLLVFVAVLFITLPLPQAAPQISSDKRLPAGRAPPAFVSVF